MDRKRKLEASLEGLFSKSKGIQQPVADEKKTDTPQPDVMGNAQKTNRDSQKKGAKSAEKKPSGTVEVKPSDVVPEIKPGTAPTVQQDAVFDKKATPEAKIGELVKEIPQVKPVEPHPNPAAVSSGDRTVGVVRKVDLALTPVAKSVLAGLEDVVGEIQLLVFEINQVQYGIDVSLVQTIIKPQAVFLVPGTVEYLKGMINLRGDVVPVVDLRTRFDLPPQEKTKDTRFVVVKVNNISASLVVDRVDGVERIPLNVIEKPSGFVVDVDNQYLTGMARYKDQIILILDLLQTIRPHLVEQR